MAVRIVADDLTGALDSVAPFAAAMGPLPVFWDPAAPRGGSYALDTETRQRPGAWQDWTGHLEGVDLAFKKIDSLLRGATADEIAACLRDGRFASAIIAPAFPAQGRITRAGRQYALAPDRTWQPVACDLLAALRARLPVRHGGADALAGEGYVLCDAESEADLAAIALAGKAMVKPVLWCGSAGLARALAGPPRAQGPFAPPTPLLILIGSDHAISRAQHDAIAAHRPGLVTALASSEQAALEAAVAKVAEAITRKSSAALAVALPAGSPETARQVLDAVFELIVARLPPPGSLCVTGGETLYGLLQVLGARSLLATGEVMPGVPHARIAGGPWHDLPVVAKSGGFGEPDLLIRLVESVMP